MNGTLYFIYNRYTGLIKIGISGNLAERMENLELASGVNLDLIGCLDGGCDYEKKLHSAFHECRAVGEWFRPNEEIVALARNLSSRAIEDVIAAHQHEIDARERAIEEARSVRRAELAEQKRIRDEAKRKKERAAAEKKRRQEERKRKKAREEAEARHIEMAEWRNASASLAETNQLPRSQPVPSTIEVLPRQRARNLQFAGIVPGVTRVSEGTPQ